MLHSLFEPDPTMSPDEVQELKSVTGELPAEYSRI